MPMALSWRPHLLASALHAAVAAARKHPLADPRLAETIPAASQPLLAAIDAAHLPHERFFRHLVPLAARAEGRRALAEASVVKTIGRSARLETLVSQVAAGLAELEAALQAALPKLSNELPLRERPLREQWEARGPGLLHQLGLVTEEALLPETCEVLLVHPATGGGGEAHLAYNSVRIEAVLANPIAELPEVVRLAWLIGQLQMDLPRYSEGIHGDRLPYVAAYALLPATLRAAEQVELARCDVATLALAIDRWRLPVPAGVDAASLVWEWWATYEQSRPDFRVALAALDQMFG